MKILDLTGKRFGRLIALERIPAQSRTTWKCICDCGNTTYVALGNLGRCTKSCGCIRKETAANRERKFGRPGVGAVVRYYKRNAHVRDIEWKIEDREFAELLSKACHYCGAAPRTRHLSEAIRTSNGVDRVDNSKGYATENCVPCCNQCNRAKGSLSMQEFLSWIQRVSENHP